MTGVGHVKVRLDWQSLQSAENPMEYISEQAQRQLRFTYRYSDAEIRYVANEELFRRSCEHAYHLCRKLAEKRWARDQKAWKHGGEPSQQPLEWRVSIKFHRPQTRGFANREV
jgi:hypothetical protein